MSWYTGMPNTHVTMQQWSDSQTHCGADAFLHVGRSAHEARVDTAAWAGSIARKHGTGGDAIQNPESGPASPCGILPC